MSKQSSNFSNNDKTSKEKNPSSQGQSGFLTELLGWIEVIVAAVVIAFFLNSFILVNATVPSGSMENTIQPGDRLFGLRLTYLFKDPQRGDIVVFRYPVDDSLGKKTNYIKRIIGLPGETVEIREGKIYIDGSDTPLDEPYLKEEWTVRNDKMTFQVPENSYLMLGDNRNNSSDSRYWAERAMMDYEEAGEEITVQEALNLSYVNRKKILGKAYLRYWPLTSISLLH